MITTIVERAAVMTAVKTTTVMKAVINVAGVAMVATVAKTIKKKGTKEMAARMSMSL